MLKDGVDMAVAVAVAVAVVVVVVVESGSMKFSDLFNLLRELRSKITS